MSQQKNQSLSPTIKWADNNSFIFVTVMLRDIEKQKAQIKQEMISFEGISKNQSYAFAVDLYEPICPKKSKVFKTGSSLLFQLAKQITQSSKKWPRLTKDQKKYQFIQIDWDRWQQQSDGQKQEDYNNKKSFDGYNRLRNDHQNYDDEDDENHKRQNNIDDFYEDNRNYDEDKQKFEHQDFQDGKNQLYINDEQEVDRDGNQQWDNNNDKNQQNFHDHD